MNVLIVDDEQIIRHGMERVIQQFDGYEVVGTADDGETALKWLSETDHLPDLIITDILMQYIDGLDLIAKVNELYPGVRCTILSGHEDFHLAQKAIDLKVLRYITKPVEPKELYAVLETIRQEIHKEQKNKIDLLRKEQLTTNASLYVRDKLLSDLFEGRLVSVREISCFAEYFPFSLENQFHGGVIRILKASAELTNRDYLLYSVAVKQLFSETILVQCRGFVMIKDTNTLVFGLSDGYTEAVEAVQQFSYLAESVLSIPIALGVDEEARDLLQLGLSVADTLERMENKMKSLFNYPLEAEKRLRLAIRNGHAEEARISADAFIGLVLESRFGLEPILQACYKLIESIHLILVELGLEKPAAPRLVGLFIPEISRQMQDWLEDCISLRASLKTKHHNDLIIRITSFMEEHYGDCGLSLQRLADVVSVHPNYLTQTFRKQTGLSCMQYLARLRMEMAKELLNSDELKINQISEIVGYENPLYFSSYFKKWVGMNPSDYKKLSDFHV
ncbi:Two-component response regulator, YesN/AraC family, consists of REC and AraC-type DNA-binding domains [Paenibacillus sp. 1_12]|uniref:response regulator n=1 Tax=Paenibacillus sp. 1_12 TaxID=1566278 RepID=UPI0008E1C63A|nr:response regulator [Paenibacillus sp. 1_12]SFL55510.1 Two-component response regulator, YesN/AraC family, consists of REC and AraC-type DNA-binding domains [Paenibacillus sp. 1_12]